MRQEQVQAHAPILHSWRLSGDLLKQGLAQAHQTVNLLT